MNVTIHTFFHTEADPAFHTEFGSSNGRAGREQKGTHARNGGLNPSKAPKVEKDTGGELSAKEKHLGLFVHRLESSPNRPERRSSQEEDLVESWFFHTLTLAMGTCSCPVPFFFPRSAVFPAPRKSLEEWTSGVTMSRVPAEKPDQIWSIS